MSKKSLRSSKGGVSIPGQVERRLERSAAVWKRRCEGATYSTLMREFGVSKTSIHNYIEDARVILREETQEMAARERAQALELLDNAIEKITPHINGEIVIETKTRAPNDHRRRVASPHPSLRGPGQVTRQKEQIARHGRTRESGAPTGSGSGD